MIEELRQAALLYAVLLIAISLHEYGHAKMADLRGDPLPRAQGRVTLNPVAHWDLIGTLLIPGLMILLPVFLGFRLPFALIGWGKPVQISLPNPRTRTKDDILITLAGPAMNLVQALVYAVALGFCAARQVPGPDGALDYANPELVNFLFIAIRVNCMLVAFNLLPIPPLDGSRIFRYVVGMGTEFYMVLSRYSIFILLLLVNIRIGGRSILSHVTVPVTTWLMKPFLLLADVIVSLFH